MELFTHLKMKPLISLIVLLTGCCAVQILAATPDAGQLLREQQSQVERLPAQRPAKASDPVVEGPMPTTSGVMVLVKEIHFKGFEGLASEPELRAVVNGSIGRKLGVAELQQLVEAVTVFLRNKGFFLARAYLPKQDVTDGVVEIAIIQARSDGEVGISRASGVRVRDEQLKQVAAAAIKPGQPLHEQDLERVLLLMNDIPGVTARAVLSPGATPGTTRVTINVTEASLFSGAIWGDNYGNRYTGAWRGNGYFSLNDPFHLGDQFNLMVSGASGLAQGRVSYSAPLGARGLRGNITYSNMQYKLGQELAGLEGKGTASTIGAGVSYPLIRRRSFNLNLNAGLERNELKDDAYGYNIRHKRLEGGNVGITGDYADQIFGGGYTTWAASLTSGNLNLSRNRSDYDLDQGRLVYDNAGDYIQVPAAKTAGTYTHVNLSGSRLQRVTSRLSLAVSYYGQLSSKNLDSSEKFNLGGPYGVRAYPVGEASGDEGHLLNFELREDLPWGAKWGNFQVIGFLDTGYITLYKNPWPGAINTATHNNDYWLSGTGLGFGFNRPGLYSVHMNYAYKLGDNPGRSATGKDADGRDDSGRLWLMGQLMF